jgi:hypothetical protein
MVCCRWSAHLHARFAKPYTLAGVFRRAEFNETVQRIAFYDMGAASTVATIVEYKTVPAPKGTKGGKDAVPTLEVLGVGCVLGFAVDFFLYSRAHFFVLFLALSSFDRALGGSDWDFLVRDYLVEQFQKNPKVCARHAHDFFENRNSRSNIDH